MKIRGLNGQPRAISHTRILYMQVSGTDRAISRSSCTPHREAPSSVLQQRWRELPCSLTLPGISVTWPVYFVFLRTRLVAILQSMTIVVLPDAERSKVECVDTIGGMRVQQLAPTCSRPALEASGSCISHVGWTPSDVIRAVRETVQTRCVFGTMYRCTDAKTKMGRSSCTR